MLNYQNKTGTTDVQAKNDVQRKPTSNARLVSGFWHTSCHFGVGDISVAVGQTRSVSNSSNTARTLNKGSQSCSPGTGVHRPSL